MLKKLKKKTKALKKQLSVLMIAYKDKRTPLLSKILVGLTVAYLLSPIDLIPDFIPVLGLLDDLLIVPLLISASIRLIPKEVMADSVNYAAAHPQLLKKNNRAAAIIIVLIWLMLAALLLKYFLSGLKCINFSASWQWELQNS